MMIDKMNKLVQLNGDGNVDVGTNFEKESDSRQ